jgi:hypothetical protein
VDDWIQRLVKEQTLEKKKFTWDFRESYSRQDVAIGIDIGMEYCSVGIFVNGHVMIIPNEEGLLRTPNWVGFNSFQGKQFYFREFSMSF